MTCGANEARAWHEAPFLALGLVASFYVTMTACLGAFITLCGTTRRLSPGLQRIVMLVAAATLAALGAWQLALAF